MNVRAEIDPVLSADFAERVLARADVVIKRRRLVRRLTGGAAGFVFVSVAVLSWGMMSGMMRSPASRPASQSVASSDANPTAQTDEQDALSDFFPDAGSVARFASEYSDATYGSDTSLVSEEDPTS
jgi:hypothetical protein